MNAADLTRRISIERRSVRSLCGDPDLEDEWPPGTLELPSWRLTEMAVADTWTADALEDPALVALLEPWLDRPLADELPRQVPGKPDPGFCHSN